MTSTARRGPVLFACVSAAGQLNPLLVIAGELARRGTGEVHFASTEDRRGEVEAICPAHPLSFVSLGDEGEVWFKQWDDETYQKVTGVHPRAVRGVLEFFRLDSDVSLYETMFDRMEKAVERVRPGLMVVDVATRYAIDVAVKHGIPFVLSCPATLSAEFPELVPKGFPPALSGLPQTMTGRQRLAGALFKVRLITGLLARTPLPAFERRRDELVLNGGEGKRPRAVDAATAVLSYSVIGVEYPFPVPAHVTMVGTVLPPLPQSTPEDDADLGDWLAEHRSVVYTGFGTHMRLTRDQIATLAAAFGKLAPEHAVLWKLPAAQQQLLPPAAALPANLRIESWVPSQLDLLAHPHVRVFFNHGGGNGVHEGLSFGKPLLVMPFWMDCFDLGARVRDSGSGLVVDRTEGFSAEEIAAKLARLLTEPRFAEHAERLSGLLRAAGGAGAAADLILAKHAELAPSGS